MKRETIIKTSVFIIFTALVFMMIVMLSSCEESQVRPDNPKHLYKLEYLFECDECWVKVNSGSVKKELFLKDSVQLVKSTVAQYDRVSYYLELDSGIAVATVFQDGLIIDRSIISDTTIRNNDLIFMRYIGKE